MTLWRWDSQTTRWKAQHLEGQKAVDHPAGVRLLPLGSRRCALLSAGAATVNGAIALPLRVLDDRDEIRVDDDTMCFSAEGPATIVAFPGGEVLCGRCKGAMKAGEPGLRCPRCQVWHHESESLRCWAYADTCASCDRPTAGPGWQPEPLTVLEPPIRSDPGDDHARGA